MSFYKEVPSRQTTLESTLKFDTTPTAGSTNPVTSDGVKGAIDGAVGDASEALQQKIDEISEKAGSGYIPKGEATVATLNGLSGQDNGELYTMTDAGTLTDGSLAVVAGDTVAWDATNSVWYKAMDYAPAQYGTNEVHNLSTTITAFRTGDYIAVDGTDTAKMGKDDLLKETAENADGKVGSKLRQSALNLVKDLFSLVPLGNLESGYVKVEGGVVSIEASANYGHVLLDAKDVASINTISGASNTSVPAVVFFENSISTADYIGHLFGSEEIILNVARFDDLISVPYGCNKIAVNVRIASIDSLIGYRLLEGMTRKELFDRVCFYDYGTLHKGSVNYSSSTISFGTSDNWRYTIIDDVSNLYKIKTYAGITGQTAPAVLFFSSTEITTSNFISALYAPSASEGETYVGLFDSDFEVPNNAVIAVVNIRTQYLDNSLGYYAVKPPEKRYSKRKLMNDGTGRFKVEGGVPSYEAHNNWSYAEIDPNRLGRLRVLAGHTGTTVPAVLFFSSRETTPANYISSVFGTIGGDYTGLYFDGKLAVPKDAKWCVINYYNEKNDYFAEVENGGDKHEIVVAKSGGNFDTIKQAVDFSDDGVVIKVMSGVYEEEIDCFEREVNIVGIDKQSCIWVCKKGTYDNPPLEASVGHIENITLYSKYEYGESAEIGSVTGAYACHVESARSSAIFAHGKSLTFKNCILRSDFAPAIGMGALNGWSFRLEDCELINGQVIGRGSYLDDGSIGAMYIHDQNYTEIKEKASITIKNCIFRNLNFNNALALKNNGLVDGRGIDFAFVFNILCSPAGKTSGNLWWRTADHFENGWSNSPVSFGNSNSALDS